MFQLLVQIIFCLLLGRAAIGEPAPIRIAPSYHWDGVDGPWTSFPVQIGGGPQPQILRLFPSFSLPEFYLIHPDGCSNAPKIPINGMTCESSRGDVFNHNVSTNYIIKSIYNFGIAAAFRDFGFATVLGQVGWDSVELDYPQKGNDIKNPNKVDHLTLVEITEWNYTWVGMFGLDVRPSNLSDLGGMKAPQDTLLRKLKQENLIPSLSWAYTAGSRWYGSGSQGSLTLGGFDEKRMIPNEVGFPFHDDSEKVHTAWVENITLAGWNENNQGNQSFDLTRTNFTTHIDSSRPYIYLPSSLYNEIAEILDLRYDNRSNTLIVSDEREKVLKAQKPSISFTLTPLSRNKMSVEPVTITMPYESIVLKLEYPLAKLNQSVHYVPIRKADDPAQYVLGRAFLQNAYIVSDYERRSFSIHQATLQNGDGPEPSIRSILITNTTTNSLDSWRQVKKPLSRSSVLGISIGAIFLTLINSSLAAYMCYKRRQESKVGVEGSKVQELSDILVRVEAGGSDTRQVFEAGERDTPQAFEADSSQIHEIPVNMIPSARNTGLASEVHEMPASSASLSTSTKDILHSSGNVSSLSSDVKHSFPNHSLLSMPNRNSDPSE